MSELKPCPFCGKEPAIHANFAICVNDDCEQSDYWTGLEVDAWNTRPIEDALRVQLAARDALIERLVGAGIEINSCTKVSTFSAEYYTLCKAQREWNEAVTDWEILKGGEE